MSRADLHEMHVDRQTLEKAVAELLADFESKYGVRIVSVTYDRFNGYARAMIDGRCTIEVRL